MERVKKRANEMNELLRLITIDLHTQKCNRTRASTVLVRVLFLFLVAQSCFPNCE